MTQKTTTLDHRLAAVVTAAEAVLDQAGRHALGYLYGGESITFTPGTVAQPDEAVLSLSVRTSGNGFDES